MKKAIISIFIILICFKGFGQTLSPVTTPGVTNRSSLPVEDKYLFARQHFGLPRYSDTTQCNTYNGSVDSCGAMIFTYDRMAVWFRSCSNGRKWIMLDPSGVPSVSNSWNLYGNNGLFTSAAGNVPFGIKIPNYGISFITNNTTRLILDSLGIVRSSGAANVALLMDSVTKTLYYGTAGGSGSTPTWQQTLTAGSTLNQDNDVDAGGNDFRINDAGELGLSADSITLSANAGSNHLHIKGDSSSLNKRISYESNLSSTFTQYTLIDKNYADNSSPYVTPEEYGAVGNGSTNDATAIQSAVNSGYPVWFGQKNYRVSTTISVPASAQLIGSGGASIISMTANDTILNLQGSNIQIKGLTLQGSSSGGAQTGIAIIGNVGLTLYRNSIQISDCVFNNFGFAGFYGSTVVGLYHEGGVYMVNSYATGCAIGIFNDTRSEYNTYSNCVVYNCTTGWNNQGGNNNWTGGAITSCTTGVILGSGANNGHCSMSGAKINHNTTNISASSTSLGYTFDGCSIFVGDISIVSSNLIKFIGCEIGDVTTITSTSNTNCEFSECKFTGGGNPALTLTGTAPAFRNNYWVGGVPSYATLSSNTNIVFAGATNTQNTNSNLVWNNTANNLGVGTNPSYRVDISGGDLNLQANRYIRNNGEAMWWSNGTDSTTFGTSTAGYNTLIYSGGGFGANPRLKFNGTTGRAAFPFYGAGTYIGTPTYSLQVDASGNLIEGAAVTAAPVTSVSGTANQITSTGGTTPVLALASGGTLPGNWTMNGTLGTVTPSTGAFTTGSFSGLLSATNAAGISLDGTNSALLKSGNHTFIQANTNGGIYGYANNGGVNLFTFAQYNSNIFAATSLVITTPLLTTSGRFTIAGIATTGTGTGSDLSITNSTLTTGSAASIALTGTAAASNTKTGLTITSLGANATSTQTVTGLSSTVTNTGTGATNIAATFSASGGAGSNNAIVVPASGGVVLIGKSTSNGVNNLLQVANNVSWGTSGQGTLVSSGNDAYIDASVASGGLIFRTNGSTTALTLSSAQLSTFSGAVDIAVAKPLNFKSGTNTRAGNAVLVAGTVTVSNTTCTANTIVILTRKTSGGTIGTAITYTVSAGSGFTITSDNILDTSTFSYMLIENS